MPGYVSSLQGLSRRKAYSLSHRSAPGQIQPSLPEAISPDGLHEDGSETRNRYFPAPAPTYQGLSKDGCPYLRFPASNRTRFSRPGAKDSVSREKPATRIFYKTSQKRINKKRTDKLFSRFMSFANFGFAKIRDTSGGRPDLLQKKTIKRYYANPPFSL